jgi:hypothetical protein
MKTVRNPISNFTPASLAILCITLLATGCASLKQPYDAQGDYVHPSAAEQKQQSGDSALAEMITGLLNWAVYCQ